MRHARDRFAGFRLALSLVFFGGLAALEVSRGLARLDRQRERHGRELVELLDRQTHGLGQEVERLLGQAQSHCAHLARTPLLSDFLDDRSEDNARTLNRLLLPYLVSFRGIDRICVLDDAWIERVRCERMGSGVAALPAGHMREAPREDVRALLEDALPGEVLVSPLLEDTERVEIAESDRLVFHYACRVETETGHRGAVVVTAYAAPLMHALASFEPLPGVTSALLSAAGAPFASPRPVDGGILARVRARSADSPPGAAPASDDGVLILAAPLRSGPASRLITMVPAEALARSVGPPRGERVRVVLTTVGIVALIALGSAFFVRASLRAQRLRETEGFLERIRRESRKHRALMEAAADLILVVDPEAGEIHDWNLQAGRFLGLGAPPATAGARTSLDAVGPALPDDSFRELRACVRTAGGTPGAPATSNLVVRDAQGARLELEVRCIAIEYGDERMVEVLLVDRTRERGMERQVRTAERLSSLGLLTAGVAHEINNPLEGIANYLDLMERPGLTAERRTRYAGLVRKGFERIREIVGDLLRFARSGQDSGEADVAGAVRGALDVARYAEDLRSVHVDLSGLDDPLRVPGSERRLEQVVLNLLLNAGRAMGGRGRIRIRADRTDPEWVELSVEDDGPGIAEEDLERIFDPFFSRAGGTGLGLAVSYGIVQAHGGILEARHRPGGGARLVVRLPRRSPEPGEDSAEASDEEA